jgi:hypothetical protein
MKIQEALSKGYTGDKVMGVDISSTSLAFSCIDGGRLKSWGKIFIVGENNFDRCADVISKSGALFRSISPELVLFESSAYVNNNAVMKQLSMIFGAAAGAARLSGAKVLDVPPVTWQSYIGNPPNSKKVREQFAQNNPDLTDSQLKVKLRGERKQRNIDFVGKTYDVELVDDDVADAVCIGYYASEVLTTK